MRGCFMDTYKVKKLNHPINLEIAVPGSKSITNRALFLAALGNGAVRILLGSTQKIGRAHV